MTLRPESADRGELLRAKIAASLSAVTKLGGNVELVDTGTLPSDGKAIADEAGSSGLHWRFDDEVSSLQRGHRCHSYPLVSIGKDRRLVAG
jgi:hypothetical protein